MDDVNDLWPWIQYKEENFLELTIFTRHFFLTGILRPYIVFNFFGF